MVTGVQTCALPIFNKQQDIGVAVENDIRIRADDTEIYTLIKTFTDNAIRYTPAGGRIDIGFSETPTTLTIWVEDDGPGIPAAERSRVTDAFYRILGTEQQGTGLIRPRPAPGRGRPGFRCTWPGVCRCGGPRGFHRR